MTEALMMLRRQPLKDGRELAIREAEPDDAAMVVERLEVVSGESDFLSFGPGEFGIGVDEEAEFFRDHQASDNKIYLLGLVDGVLVSGLNFAGGPRPRIRHSGEFGIWVQKEFWFLGVGSYMVDALLDWARETGIVTKINLLVRSDNERAIDLYRRKGFAIEGTIKKDALIDGIYYDHVAMGLEL